MKILNNLPKILSNTGKFFIRFRSPRDSRVFLGKELSSNEYILVNGDLTGEKNDYLAVYEESEIIELLKSSLGIKNYKIFHLYEENYHGNKKVLNADIVIWGDFSI